MRVGFLLLATTLGCAGTHYTPRMAARGEIILQYDHGFEAWSQGVPIARSVRWDGLADYVGCVPAAREHAVAASSEGSQAIGFSIAGGSLGLLGVGGLIAGGADEPNRWTWVGAGVGAAVLGAIFAGMGYVRKGNAIGHAVDAINYYNDAVGSVGSTCVDQNQNQH